VLEQGRVPARTLGDALEHESGLLALAGTADMREVLERARAADPDASLALEVYVHRLCGEIAAMAAAMGGLDALAFTAGVGERAAEIRSRAAAGLEFLGVAIDPRINRVAVGDLDLSRPGSATSTVVLRAREDLEIARQSRRALAPEPRG
jgi:acetate kinase